jgi:hypothetical protein
MKQLPDRLERLLTTLENLGVAFVSLFLRCDSLTANPKIDANNKTFPK